MSRYVKISVLGPKGPQYTGLEHQAALKEMMEFWDGQLAQILPDKPDLIVFPEVCDRFNNMPKGVEMDYYEYRGDKMLKCFAKKAKENNCYIAYSAAFKQFDGKYRNSTQLIDRQGEIAGIYNKNHLVTTESSISGFLYGKDADLIATDFGTIGCAICFDLNFNELREKYAESQPDIILFSSMYHGGLMQAYWAYSCRSHFVGAVHALPSTIISPSGEILAQTTNYFNHVTETINLDCKLVHLDCNRNKITAAKQKYGAKFSMKDPGLLGSVLISSETEEVTIDEIIDEFKIEILDDYMQRSLDHRYAPGNMEN